MKDIIRHKNIKDFLVSIGQPESKASDFTIRYLPDIQPEAPFESPVFRAEYFSFVFINEGRGTYSIDEKEFPFQKNTVYFTNPGHLKSYKTEAPTDGYIIALSENFLREWVHPDIFKEFPFLLAETVPPAQMSTTQFKELEVLYLNILGEYQKQGPFRKNILGNLFVVLLFKIKEYFWIDYDPLQEGNRNSQIVRAFKKELEKQFRASISPQGITHMMQVQDYANKLGLHPNYFNSVVKSKTGKTANDWIASRSVSAARSLLKTTNLPIKEIAYRLGFKEPTHFSRFFKKHARTSPGAFRKRYA